MDWAFWTGTIVFAVTIGGMLYLRDQQFGDYKVVTDRNGRRVRVIQLRAERIAELLRTAHNAPHTGQLLRRKVRMSKQSFYRAVEYMRRRDVLELVWLRTDVMTTAGYRLTKHGLEASTPS